MVKRRSERVLMWVHDSTSCSRLTLHIEQSIVYKALERGSDNVVAIKKSRVSCYPFSNTRPEYYKYFKEDPSFPLCMDTVNVIISNTWLWSF